MDIDVYLPYGTFVLAFKIHDMKKRSEHGSSTFVFHEQLTSR